MVANVNNQTKTYGSQQKVKPLFDITIDVIVSKAARIESLVDFPEIIGEQIFKKVVASGKLSESQRSYKESIRIWETFMKAYGDLILPTLDLSHCLLVINEFTDPLCTVLKYVVEVDLSYCFLGPLHELMPVVAHAERLKRLSLRKNGINDITLQKLTMPVRRFKEGPMELEELDISGNSHITDDAIQFLSGFKQLKKLNLSGTSITEKGIKLLEEMGLYLCKEDVTVCQIKTEGWAEPVVKKWKKFIEDRKKRKAKPLGMYGMSRSRRLFGTIQPKPQVEEPTEEQFFFVKDCDQERRKRNSSSNSVSELSLVNVVETHKSVKDLASNSQQFQPKSGSQKELACIQELSSGIFPGRKPEIRAY